MRGRGGRPNVYSNIIPIGPGARPPEPPADLTTREAELWRRIVSSVPPGWIDGGCQHLLVDLCQHWVARDAVKLGYEQTGELELLRSWREQSRLITNLSTRLRLTPQSRFDRQRAGTLTRGSGQGQKAWELDADPPGAA
jgi:hypothetical protein